MRGNESSTNSVVSPIDRIECFRKVERIFTTTASEILAFPELNRGGVMACSGGGFDARIVEASILSLGTGREYIEHLHTINIILSSLTVFAQLLRKILA